MNGSGNPPSSSDFILSSVREDTVTIAAAMSSVTSISKGSGVAFGRSSMRRELQGHLQGPEFVVADGQGGTVVDRVHASLVAGERPRPAGDAGRIDDIGVIDQSPAAEDASADAFGPQEPPSPVIVQPAQVRA